MKHKSIIGFLLFLMGVTLTTTSCEDMLTPDMDRYTTKSAQDTLYSYFGILKSMQNIAERYVILGETRGDLVTTAPYANDSVARLSRFDDVEDGESALLRVADYYKVINGCNFYLHSADTSALQNTVRYMRKEYAQVQAMRAWTYLQLVQHYGSVPFITKPVRTTADGQRLEREAPRATKDNLVDLLLAAGLSRAEQFEADKDGGGGIINYTTYDNGNVTISSQSCLYPVSLVMADLYLLKGDYDNAAIKYYKYMTENNAVPAFTSRATLSPDKRDDDDDGVKRYSSNTDSWYGRFKNYSTGSSNDLITLIPGASNSEKGTIITSVQNVYGFKTTAYNSTTNSKEEDETTSGDAVVTKEGAITLEADLNYLQLIPSDAYAEVNAIQSYCTKDPDNNKESYIYYSGGDPRINGAAPYHEDSWKNTVVRNRFIHKFCPAQNIRYDRDDQRHYAKKYDIYYGVQVYRKALMALRYAEAVNRAGFPAFAFSVLKDGFSVDNYPTIRTSSKKVKVTYPVLDEQGEPVLDDQGEATTADSFRIDTLVLYTVPAAKSGGSTYIDSIELVNSWTKPFLSFAEPEFKGEAEGVYGVHSLGGGETRGTRDTVYTFDRKVAEKIMLRRGQKEGWDEVKIADETDSLALFGVMKAVRGQDPRFNITKDDVIEGVEDLIIDELALETAFEGNRYPDLLRFASHKGHGVIDAEWLADKIARRNGYRDEALYSKLLGGNHWYLPLPKD